MRVATGCGAIMSKTKIEWTELSWNPVVGCSIISPGCTNCYAMRMAARIRVHEEYP
jgi:protein gp37